MGGWVGRGKPGYQEAGVTPEQFETILREWGRYYGERPGPEWDDGTPDARVIPGGATIHPLERARQFAPGRRRTFVERQLHGRDGVSRRRAMGAAAGLAVLPADFVDPVPCVETRPVIGTPRPDPRYTDTIRAVQEAWLTLRKYWPDQAEVVRLHYQVRGMTRKEKAAQMPGGAIGLRRYKDLLRDAQTWLHARLAR